MLKHKTVLEPIPQMWYLMWVDKNMPFKPKHLLLVATWERAGNTPISGGCIHVLTHWGRVTHICIDNLTIIGSDNGLSPGRRQAITWTNVGIFLIGPIGTNFSEMSIEIHTFSFKKIHLNMSSGKWRPFCLGFNVLTHWGLSKMVDIFQTLFFMITSWPRNTFCTIALYERESSSHQ